MQGPPLLDLFLYARFARSLPSVLFDAMLRSSTFMVMTPLSKLAFILATTATQSRSMIIEVVISALMGSLRNMSRGHLRLYLAKSS